METLKIVVFVSIVSSSFSDRCVINKYGNDQCASSVCFSHFISNPEGDLERFDCEEEPKKLPAASCLRLLNETTEKSVCLGDVRETHCCCLSDLPARICAPEFRKTSQLAQLWTTEQILYFLFANISLLVVVLLLVVFYRTSVRFWPTDNIPIPDESRLPSVLLWKAILLLLSFFVVFFPFRKTCMSHPQGVFVTPRLFLYQIFPTGMAPSLYFSFPLVFFLFEFCFYLRIKRFKLINKPGGLGLALFKMLTVPLFFYETFISTYNIWQLDRQPSYCKYNGVIWQLVISHVFILVYHVLLAFQIAILCRMRAVADETQGDSEETERSHMESVLSTQTPETQIESDFNETVYIYPKPFHVPRLGLSVLNVKNNRKNEWLALRALLSTTGFYKLYPSKFLIPPGKEISIEVEQCTRADSPCAQHNLLVEWFSLGPNPPCVDSQRLWSKPYLVPQSEWQYYVLPIYVNDSTNSLSSNPSSSLN